MTAPTPLIDATVMSSRVRDHGLNTLSPVVTMVMSGVYATSALALADILRTPDDRWVRLSLWFMLMLAATFTMTRQLYMNALSAHPVPHQLPLQLMLGFINASSFACLPLSTGGPDGWRFALTLLLLTLPLAVVVPMSLLRTVKLDHYAPSLHDTVRHRLDDVRQTFRRLPAAAAFLLAFVVFAWVTRGLEGPWNWIAAALAVLFCIRAVIGLRDEGVSFARLIAEVEQARLAAAAQPDANPG